MSSMCGLRPRFSCTTSTSGRPVVVLPAAGRSPAAPGSRGRCRALGPVPSRTESTLGLDPRVRLRHLGGEFGLRPPSGTRRRRPGRRREEAPSIAPRRSNSDVLGMVGGSAARCARAASGGHRSAGTGWGAASSRPRRARRARQPVRFGRAAAYAMGKRSSRPPSMEPPCTCVAPARSSSTRPTACPTSSSAAAAPGSAPSPPRAAGGPSRASRRGTWSRRLEDRCRGALRRCLDDAEPSLRTRSLQLDRVGSSASRTFRLTAWVERVGDGAVVFSACAANDGGGRCEATITLATGDPTAASARDRVAA